MRRALVAALALIAGCAAAPGSAPQNAQAEATATVTTQTATTAPAAPNLIPIPAAPASGSTAAWPAPQLQPIVQSQSPVMISVTCAGAFAQGGVALCRTIPGARINVDGTERGRADADGWAVIGFDRDSPAQSIVQFVGGTGEVATKTFDIMLRSFSIQRVDNLPPQTVNPTDPAVVARIHREAELKAVGFASRADTEGWLDGFRWPVEGRISGSWGNQRVDNGVPKSPHYGVDIAVPIGTEVHAPASGVVAFANNDMFLEGGLVLVDHGQGLISMYLHMSRVDVHAGQRIAQGDTLGLSGDRGRATGPHVCWRMKWRDRQLDPSLGLTALSTARTELAGPAR